MGASREKFEEHEIDALYGLEPVIEPGDSTQNATEFTAVQCPYCGESFETVVGVCGATRSH